MELKKEENAPMNSGIEKQYVLKTSNEQFGSGCRVVVDL
jgi:hypothetical protein